VLLVRCADELTAIVVTMPTLNAANTSSARASAMPPSSRTRRRSRSISHYSIAAVQHPHDPRSGADV
jgi:hypothetical protein